MKKLLSLLLSFILLNISVFGAEPSSSAEPAAAPVHTISAHSAIVMEKETGRILFEKDAYSQKPMASTTKIMTAIVALEKGDLSSKIEISPTASGVEGSSMYLAQGEIMTLEELLYGLMLASGNDAAVAIAEHFGGVDTFVGMMNQKAKEIGAVNTNFTNPNGLPDDKHYSTAYDMALLTAYGMKNPEFAKIVSTKTKEISGEGKQIVRTLENHNKLLSWYEGCMGVKTGFTEKAGRCLVTAARRNEMTVICVTLNAYDDWKDHAFMLDNAFLKYKMTKVLDNSKPLGNIKILNSYKSSLPLYGTDLYYPLAEGEKCEVIPAPYESLTAPVMPSASCGTAEVKFGDKIIGTVTLSVKDYADKNILRQTARGFKNTLKLVYAKWINLFR